jgi:outer membrane protein
MKQFQSKIVFTFLFLHFGFFAFSQDNLSLSDCFFIAFKNNLALKEAQINEKIAVLNRNASYAKLLPNISANASNRFSFGRGIDPNTNAFIDTKFKSYSGNLSSNLSLFSGFLNINTIKQAKQDVEINKTLYAKLKNEITIEIASKFITILYTEEIVKAINEQISGSKKQLEMVTLKFNSGYVSESEVFKIKSELANQEVNLLNTNSNLASAYADLKSILNMPFDEDLKLNPLINENLNELNLENKETEIIKKALDKNPTFQLSNFQMQKAKRAVAINRASIFPSLRANFSYGSNYSDSNLNFNFDEQIQNNKNYGLALNLSIPIFNQLQSSSKIKESKLLFDQSKIRNDIEKSNISKVILKAINDAKISKKKYEAAQLSNEFSKRSFEAESLKYSLGKITLNDLSITKNNFFNAQAELIKSKYEYFFNNALIKFYLGESFGL